MIIEINPPVEKPYSETSKWLSFGNEYDAVKLLRKDLSTDLCAWLDSIGVIPTSASMFTLFPGKIPPILVDAPYCEQDDHARIYWVYDAPVHFTWYSISAPLGIENIESLIGVEPEHEERKFKDPFTGWYPNPDILIEEGNYTIQPNTCVLINAGIPIKTICEGSKPAKVFSIGFVANNVNPMYNNGNGMKYQDAITCMR